MKKILALLVCLLTISTGVRADDDRPVRFDQLPADILHDLHRDTVPRKRWRWQRWKRIFSTRSMK